jgi:hypothetical protein
MPVIKRFVNALKAAVELGPEQVALNGLYRFGLLTGHYRRVTPDPVELTGIAFRSPFSLPPRETILPILGNDGLQSLLAEADEIAAGRIRLFGGDPVDLDLTPPGPLAHWTAFETHHAPLTIHHPSNDIKFTWEPARFGWAFVLGRAWHMSGDEKYAEAFWRHFDAFQQANPPYYGPNWNSGQEAALRLMAFAWAAQVFAGSVHSTPEACFRLTAAIVAHAQRIPPTLVYARSQNNNHLLTEAAGLYTAGMVLRGHPAASKWRDLGWKWLNAGLQAQIDSFGEYSQHSTNYHRLMLQVALWVDALLKQDNSRVWPRATREALGRATHWALALLDPASGRTPNLGANDGALIFPLSSCRFEDFRPVLHAMARAFLRYQFPPGIWDEMSLWFGQPMDGAGHMQLPRYLGDQLAGKDSWAYLRAAQFKSRPSHADQLHFDLWWRGLNVAQDAGTYHYNAPAPWENSLTTTLVHNTVSVDGLEQMTRAGRFLYVDRANAYYRPFLSSDPHVMRRARARHYAYWRKGIRHARTATVFDDDRWLVEDELEFLPYLWMYSGRRTFRLHWLLPDWEWELEERGAEVALRLKSPHGWVGLQIDLQPGNLQLSTSLVCAGEYLYGQGAPDPIRGWVSPTYGAKIPALSLAVEVQSRQDVKFTSEFIFPQ